MRKTPIYLIVLFALSLGTSLLAQPPHGAPLGDVAASLPPLPVAEGSVTIPLENAGPWTWRPVREDIQISSEGDALTVSYTVVSGQPAGAALLIPPGTLKDLDHLRIALRGNRNAQLSVTLRDAQGAVFSFPAVPVRVGKARQAEVYAEDLTFFAPQAEGPDPGDFDPSQAVMIALLDISGFMGSETPEVSWVIENLQAVSR